MALGGIWSRITGGIVALGIGAAARDAIDPVLEVEKQQAWARRAVRVLDPGDAAAAEARGLAFGVNHKDDAKRHGIGQARWNTLAQLAREYPGLSELLTLLRRGDIKPDAAKQWLNYQAFSDTVADDLLKLANVKLAPSDVANAIQQDFVTDENYLPDPDWTGPPFTIPAERQPISPTQEYADEGIDKERGKVLAQLVGLPPGPVELNEMLNRGLIDEAAWLRGIREGHTKTKWAPPLKALRHPILSAIQLANAVLRGWLPRAQLQDAGSELRDRLAKTGMDVATFDRLLQLQGRPITYRQVFIGMRRGGVYDGPITDLTAPFLKSLQESDIRPEWYNLAWAQRHSLPSAFVLRRLAQDGDVSPDQTRTLLEWMGWPEFLIGAVVTSWTGGAAGAVTAGPRVKTAQTSAVTEIRSAFLIGQADETQARGWLAGIGVEQTEIDGMIPIWNVMREVPQRGLTVKQIQLAYQNLPAQWPRARALQTLQLLGLTADDAATILDE